MIDLSSLLGTGMLAGYEPSGWRISEKDRASGAIRDFLQAYANSGNSERDAAEARAFLKPEYAVGIPDFANMGIPRQANGLTPSFPDKQLGLKINGNEATETVVYDIEDKTFTQKFHLERINGEWWISGIEPVVTTQSETVYTADELRQQDENQVLEVVLDFLYAVVSGMTSGLDKADPRSYLAPGADSVIDDLATLDIKVYTGNNPSSRGVTPVDVRVDADNATSTVIFQSGGSTQPLRREATSRRAWERCRRLSGAPAPLCRDCTL